MTTPAHIPATKAAFYHLPKRRADPALFTLNLPLQIAFSDQHQVARVLLPSHVQAAPASPSATRPVLVSLPLTPLIGTQRGQLSASTPSRFHLVLSILLCHHRSAASSLTLWLFGVQETPLRHPTSRWLIQAPNSLLFRSVLLKHLSMEPLQNAVPGRSLCRCYCLFFQCLSENCLKNNPNTVLFTAITKVFTSNRVLMASIYRFYLPFLNLLLACQYRNLCKGFWRWLLALFLSILQSGLSQIT